MGAGCPRPLFFCRDESHPASFGPSAIALCKRLYCRRGRFPVTASPGNLVNMAGLWDRHIQPALQLMRWKLAITAIADGQAALVLSRWSANDHGNTAQAIWDVASAVPVLMMSLGLYAGGMILNDLVDQNRDRFLEPDKPLPSGRISPLTGNILCGLAFAVGITGGVWTAFNSGYTAISLFFLFWTIALILFYNFVGKFLGASGVLSLGLIRFFHAATAQPHLTIFAHPLLLLNHVTILSAVCYVLEGKRPRLTQLHRWTIGGGLVLLDVFLIGGVLLATVLRHHGHRLAAMLGLHVAIIWPLLLAGVFAALAYRMLRRLPLFAGQVPAREVVAGRHRAGRKLMFLGLLWLVIYDAAFIILGFL